MLVDRTRVGLVELLTLNRPEVRNALNPQMLDELHDALVEAEASESVRAIVVTGAGDKAFSAGMDLKAFSESGPWKAPEKGGMRDFFKGAYAKPLVAAVNGAAVAGGFEVVLGCDLVVAAEHARFALPEVKRGLFAAGGGVLLGSRIPLAIALEIGLTGDPIDAHRALAVGLVNRVVPADRVIEEAVALASLIARNGPRAVSATKQLMRRAVMVGVPDALAGIEEMRASVFESQDAREGARAFVEKREPRWTGS